MTMNAYASRALVLSLAAGVALGLIHIASVIGFHVSFDPNEGWNAYFAQLAMRTGSPYPAPHGFMIDNYPPLSFYLIGALGKLFGDALIAGRIVALAALAATAGAIWGAARRMGCVPAEAAFAALFFVAGIMLTSDYAGMNDPQMLGHAIAGAGLLFALREPRTPRDMVLAALCLVAALFVKHNLVALPAALVIWLTLLNRRLGLTFAACGLIFLLIGLGVFKQAFGFGLPEVLVSPRTYSVANAQAAILAWLRWSAVPLCGTATLFLRSRSDPYAMFCCIYAAVGTAIGVYFSGGAGVDANVFFDADIALALSGALLLNRFSSRRAVTAFAYAVPLAIALWSLDSSWLESDFWLHPLAEERATANAEIAFIRSTNGPAICELPSLCHWAGKETSVDVFNVQQAFLTKAMSDKGLARDIAAKRFGVVQLEQLAPFPLTARIEYALNANYRVARQDDGRVFLVPR